MFLSYFSDGLRRAEPDLGRAVLGESQLPNPTVGRGPRGLFEAGDRAYETTARIAMAGHNLQVSTYEC